MHAGQGSTGRGDGRGIFRSRVLLGLGLVALLCFSLFGAQARAEPSRITQFDLGLGGSEIPRDLLVGPEGDLWFTAWGKRAVGRLGPDGSVKMSTTGPEGPHPNSLAVGPEGDVWVGLRASDRSGPGIGRIGEDGEIATVTELRSGTRPNEFAVDPGGGIWYASTSGSRPAIGRITPSGEVFQVDLRTGYPRDIVVGAEGDAWFTMGPAGVGGGIRRASFDAGEITITDLPGGELGADSRPRDLLSGADGYLWFTDTGEDTVGRVNTANDAIELMRPNAGIGRNNIALGPDGDLWTAGFGGFHRVSPQRTITYHHFPGQSQGRMPSHLVTGQDGRIWFTTRGEYTDGSVGWISTSGDIVELRSELVEGSEPEEIVVGADGNLWFTDIQEPGMIGRIVPGDDTPPPAPPAEEGGSGHPVGPEDPAPPEARDPRPALGRLVPARRVLGMGRAGRAVMPVACKGGRPCVGRFVLRIGQRPHGHSGKFRLRVIGVGRFRVQERTWSKVLLRISRYGRLRLRHAPRGRLGAVLTVRGAKMRFGGFSRSRVWLMSAPRVTGGSGPHRARG